MENYILAKTACTEININPKVTRPIDVVTKQYVKSLENRIDKLESFTNAIANMVYDIEVARRAGK